MTDIKTLEEIFKGWKYSKPKNTFRGWWKKSRPGYMQNQMTEAEMRNIKQALNIYIEERERLARIDEVNELDKFLDNQKAVGAVRAWSLQRKQMIKSELEG